jgi:hypothetical protein
MKIETASISHGSIEKEEAATLTSLPDALNRALIYLCPITRSRFFYGGASVDRSISILRSARNRESIHRGSSGFVIRAQSRVVPARLDHSKNITRIS